MGIVIKETCRIVERNAQLIQRRYGDIGTPCCWIAGATQKHLQGRFRRLGHGLFAVINIAQRFCTTQFSAANSAGRSIAAIAAIWRRIRIRMGEIGGVF